MDESNWQLADDTVGKQIQVVDPPFVNDPAVMLDIKSDPGSVREER